MKKYRLAGFADIEGVDDYIKLPADIRFPSRWRIILYRILNFWRYL